LPEFFARHRIFNKRIGGTASPTLLWCLVIALTFLPLREVFPPVLFLQVRSYCWPCLQQVDLWLFLLEILAYSRRRPPRSRVLPLTHSLPDFFMTCISRIEIQVFGHSECFPLPSYCAPNGTDQSPLSFFCHCLAFPQKGPAWR